MIASALVLAGSRPGGDPFANALGVEHKALIEIEGRTLLERVLHALRDAGVQRIAVSCSDGPVSELALALGADPIPACPGPSASVAAAFEVLGAPMIVTTSDHALLQGSWVEQLLRETPDNADLSVMLAQRDLIETAVPSSRRTYLRFADGQWSGCNLFYLQTGKARRAIELWSMVEADRKRPWKIAARLGFGTLFSMLLGRLSLAEGLARLGARIGVSASIVAAEDGLAAIDVDKAEDLELVKAMIRDRGEK